MLVHIEPLVSACYINCSVHLAVCDLNGFLDVDLDTKQKPCSAMHVQKKKKFIMNLKQ